MSYSIFWKMLSRLVLHQPKLIEHVLKKEQVVFLIFNFKFLNINFSEHFVTYVRYAFLCKRKPTGIPISPMIICSTQFCTCCWPFVFAAFCRILYFLENSLVRGLAVHRSRADDLVFDVYIRQKTACPPSTINKPLCTEL